MSGGGGHVVRARHPGQRVGPPPPLEPVASRSRARPPHSTRFSSLCRVLFLDTSRSTSPKPKDMPPIGPHVDRPLPRPSPDRSILHRSGPRRLSRRPPRSPTWDPGLGRTFRPSTRYGSPGVGNRCDGPVAERPPTGRPKHHNFRRAIVRSHATDQSAAMSSLDTVFPYFTDFRSTTPVLRRWRYVTEHGQIPRTIPAMVR